MGCYKQCRLLYLLDLEVMLKCYYVQALLLSLNLLFIAARDSMTGYREYNH